MSRTMFFVVALLAALLSEAPATQQESAAVSGAQATTPSLPQRAEKDRQAIFAESSTCRAEVTRKADEQYPEIKTAARYSRVYRSRRGRFISGNNTICDRETMKKHGLLKEELEQIESEGTCKQWTPLTGPPTC